MFVEVLSLKLVLQNFCFLFFFFFLRKYPAIQTNEMRDRYKAVFNDQFAEYKELSVEVHAVLKKFDELDALMRQLPHHPESIYVSTCETGSWKPGVVLGSF